MMLPDLGPHAAFIWTSYGVVAGVLGVLGIWLVMDGAKLARSLAEFEKLTGRRRSAGAEDEPRG